MAKRNKPSHAAAAAVGEAPPGSSTPRLSDLEKLLLQIGQCLDEGQPTKAFELIRQSRVKSDWVSNALGVCQLRSGDAVTAVQTFRRLVISEGIHFRKDVPVVFIANFAAALYATGNLDGFVSTLDEIDDQQHPAVRRYREAYSRWTEDLSIGQRIKFLFVGRPPRPFEVVPLGDLT